MSEESRYQDVLLLSRFNARDKEAFVSVYKLFFTELHLYASRLYSGATDLPEDAVQDVFCSLLENNGTHFETLIKLKAFLYTSIKNRYKNYLEHQKVHNKYEEYAETDRAFASEITENELYAFLQKCLNILPENCVQVMDLYLSGYEMEEIACKLNLSLQTIYNTKSVAIRLLKEKFGKTKFINLLFYFLCKAENKNYPEQNNLT